MTPLFMIAWLSGMLILHWVGYVDLAELNPAVLLFLAVIWHQLGKQMQRAFGVLDLYVTQRMDRLEKKINMLLPPDSRDVFIESENTVTWAGMSCVW